MVFLSCTVNSPYPLNRGSNLGYNRAPKTSTNIKKKTPNRGPAAQVGLPTGSSTIHLKNGKKFGNFPNGPPWRPYPGSTRRFMVSFLGTQRSGPRFFELEGSKIFLQLSNKMSIRFAIFWSLQGSPVPGGPNSAPF